MQERATSSRAIEGQCRPSSLYDELLGHACARKYLETSKQIYAMYYLAGTFSSHVQPSSSCTPYIKRGWHPFGVSHLLVYLLLSCYDSRQYATPLPPASNLVTTTNCFDVPFLRVAPSELVASQRTPLTTIALSVVGVTVPLPALSWTVMLSLSRFERSPR